MKEGIRKLKEVISGKGAKAVVATVKAYDSQLLTCNAVFEGEDTVRKNIPLRIFNDDDGLGVAFVPSVESEVLIIFIGDNENQPQVVKGQKWDWAVIKRANLEIIINNENNVSVVTDGEIKVKSDKFITLNNEVKDSRVVTTKCLCPFTGSPHMQGSKNVYAKGAF